MGVRVGATGRGWLEDVLRGLECRLVEFLWGFEQGLLGGTVDRVGKRGWRNRGGGNGNRYR